MAVPIYAEPPSDQTNWGNRPGDGPLRPGGVEGATYAVGGTDSPANPSKTVKAQSTALTLVRDLWAGNERIHAKGQVYLPKAPAEEGEDYTIRLARSVFFNVFRHTVEAMAGFVFRRDPQLGDDVPPAIVDLWEDVDAAGTHGDVFARALLTDALGAGHNAILVEFPKTGGAQSARDEMVGGLRPYFVPILKDNIISWRTTVEGGRTILTQLVLYECQMAPSGVYAERERKRYRVFFRENGVVGFRLYEVAEDQKTLTMVDAGLYPTQDEIPVAEVPTAGRRGLFESDPPLLDLAYLNVAHYQQWSDYATSIHKTCVPILFGAGIDLSKAVVGPNAGIGSSDPAAKLSYVSHDGAALAECKAALDDLKVGMAELGIAALQSEKRVAETAAAKRINKGASDSVLSITARGLQDGIERALDFMAKYLGLPDGGSIEINRDFGDLTMQADMLTAYVGAVANAGLPVRVLIEGMQAGGLLSDDTDPAALEAEMMANAAAIADQQAQAAKDALAMQQAKGKMPSQMAG